MNILSRLLTLCLLALSAHCSYADDNDDFLSSAHNVSLCGFLSAYGSNPGLGQEAGYTRWLWRYVGVTGGIGFQDWYDMPEPPLEVRDGRGTVYERHDDADKMVKLYATAGVALRTPAVTLGSREDKHLFVQCEPALMAVVPVNDRVGYTARMDDGHSVPLEIDRTARGEGGQALSWRMKLSVALSAGRGMLSAGYIASGQDPLSGRRHLTFDGRNVDTYFDFHRLCHHFFVALTYGF